MPANKLVVRFRDGRVLKGHSMDFNPNREVFHLVTGGYPQVRTTVEVAKLKAVFFVKNYKGDPNYVPSNEFDPDGSYIGKKLKVTFLDGEVMAGVRQGYRENSPGFFLAPVDAEGNTERAFIVNDAVKSVEEVLV
ncbi:MAG: hypothetical protein R6U36_00415 [Candidatus Fermentibacteraceae bacterium]